MEEGWKFESLKVESLKVESKKAGKHYPKMVLIMYTITISTILGQCFPAFRFHAFHFQAFKLPTLLHYLILTFEQTNQIIVVLYYKHHFWQCFPAFHFQAFKPPTLLHYLILTFEQTNQIIVVLY